jgi:hypothetical protein
MFSRCPHCLLQQSVSVEQLRESRGLLTCKTCGKHFDALSSLEEQQNVLQPNSVKDDSLNRSVRAFVYPKKFWLLGCGLAAVLLLVQVVVFNLDQLLQQPEIRSRLETVCNQFGCRLPYYRNLAEWSVSHSEFHAVSENHYVFTAAISNQAAFAQVCPDIKLEMLNFNGQTIAERIFTAQQYTTVIALPSNETLEIRLAVVSPQGTSAYGGFRFNLL